MEFSAAVSLTGNFSESGHVNSVWHFASKVRAAGRAGGPRTVALGAEATVAMVGPEEDCSATASSRACLKGMFFSARICWTLFSKIHLGQDRGLVPKDHQ